MLLVLIFGEQSVALDQTAPESQWIMTNTWAPYINSQQQPHGTAAAIVDLLAVEMGKEVRWHYVPYDLSYQLVKRGLTDLAFPFFKTPVRAEEVTFSAPMFSASSHLYYNRQFLSLEAASVELNKLRIGRVSGYSYGPQLVDGFPRSCAADSSTPGN